MNDTNAPDLAFEKYKQLTEENKRIIDSLVADLAKNQSSS